MRNIKLVASILACMTIFTSFAGCSKKGGFDASREITVISREEGSGTRGAFVELFGIERKNENGEKVDYTVPTADITQSTGVMIASVSQNAHAIGYISLGSLNDSVKALRIDGAAATVENIKNGSYKISRPFNIVTKENLTEAAKDFINFILSEDGQKIVEQNGYIAATDKSAFIGGKPSGKITIAGSSSVYPVMEKLKEAYLILNPNAAIEINQSDSTTGINSAIKDICDIGMASRELKESEIAGGVTSAAIAIDGIAVIVNNQNTLDNLTVEQVKRIYTGEAVKWSDVIS